MATDRRKLFVKEYLVDLNATQAAIRAGYSEKTAKQQAKNLMNMDAIQDAIQKEMHKREQRTDITADKVLNELAKLGFSEVTDFLQVTTERILVDRVPETDEPISEIRQLVLLKDTDQIPPEKLAAISEIKQAKDGSISFKLHDKKGALDSIGKHLGMFVDKAQIKVTHDFEDMTDEELAQAIQRMERELKRNGS
jgi:phage terminase small subunit